MDLEVLKKWGNYSKGDIISDVHESTANALVVHGVVKLKEVTSPKSVKIKK